MTAIACNLGVLSAEERKEHDALSRKIFDSVLARKETAHGYAFTLDRSSISLTELALWIAMEERCCSFFDFRFDLKAGALTLKLGGGPGVREFMAERVGFEPTVRF